MSSRKKAPGGHKSIRDAATVSRPGLLVGGSDTEFRALVHDLMAFAHHIEACRDGFGSIVGLTGVQYEILMAVKRFQDEGGIGVGQVAARLHRSGAFITLEVNKLVSRGVLAKAGDPADGRRVLLSVSKQGEALVRTLAPVQQQVNDVLFACLDRKRFDRLRALAAELVGCGDRATALIDYLAAHHQAGADSRAA
jgi:MarR family transcriptional regulator, organic hydroperoxide resistance regulator